MDNLLEFRLKYKITPAMDERLILSAMAAEQDYLEQLTEQFEDYLTEPGSWDNIDLFEQNCFEYDPGSYHQELAYSTLKLIKELNNEHI